VSNGSELSLWPTQRQVLETHWFTEQLAAIGPIERLDEALGAVQLILTENAEVYPVVRGSRRTRLAKTKAVDEVPALNIWFMIDDDDSAVLLLYVEAIPSE
jgi:hypothetical protein